MSDAGGLAITPPLRAVPRAATLWSVSCADHPNARPSPCEDHEEYPTHVGCADDRRPFLSAHRVCGRSDPVRIQEGALRLLRLDAVPRKVVNVGGIPVEEQS